MSGEREQRKEKFTLTTFHSNAKSMEATRAYPRDIDATALRKPLQIYNMSGRRQQQKDKFTLTSLHSNATSVEAARAFPQDIDATAFRKNL